MCENGLAVARHARDQTRICRQASAGRRRSTYRQSYRTILSEASIGHVLTSRESAEHRLSYPRRRAKRHGRFRRCTRNGPDGTHCSRGSATPRRTRSPPAAPSPSPTPSPSGPAATQVEISCTQKKARRWSTGLFSRARGWCGRRARSMSTRLSDRSVGPPRDESQLAGTATPIRTG